MSAFLGPIHTWLYNKIKFQNEFTEVLCKYARDNGCRKEIFDILDKRYGKLEEGELEDIIDENNIHGWLQNCVHIVEDRLAYLVTSLLEERPDCFEDIKTLVCQYGRDHQMGEGKSLNEAFRFLDDLLLNGMPCDHVNVVTEEADDHIYWRQTTDIHHQYWEMMDGDVNHYYELRDSLIVGILVNSGIMYRKTGDQTFELCRAS